MIQPVVYWLEQQRGPRLYHLSLSLESRCTLLHIGPRKQVRKYVLAHTCTRCVIQGEGKGKGRTRHAHQLQPRSRMKVAALLCSAWASPFPAFAHAVAGRGRPILVSHHVGWPVLSTMMGRRGCMEDKSTPRLLPATCVPCQGC